MPEIAVQGWDGAAGCRKVRAVLAIKALPHRFRPWTLRSAREILTLDQSAVGPVMHYDGRIVTGSRAICSFLDDHHAEPRLRPRDISAAALAHIIETWADDSLGVRVDALRWLVPANRERAAERAAPAVAPAPAILAQAAASALAIARLRGRGISARDLPACEAAFHTDLDELDRLLHDRDHLLGAPHGRSMADVAVAIQLELVADTNYADSLRTRPSLWRWLQAERSAWG